MSLRPSYADKYRILFPSRDADGRSGILGGVDFDRLAERHRDAVYAQMVRLCGSHDDAEDALVEALLAAHLALPNLRDAEAFRGWLAKIARRACLRLKDRPELALFHEIADLRPGPQSQLEAAQTKRCLLEAVEGLPLLLREAFVLCDVERHSDLDAAARLGISLPALKSRLRRARSGLRGHLEESLCGKGSFSP